VYAVVQSGGRQHKVEVGSKVDVDRLNAEVGASIELDKVLLLSTDDGVTVGQPTVEGARVLATVVEAIRGDKIIVFKYKAKVRYRRKTGHRQDYTRLEIKDIVTSDEAVASELEPSAEGDE
jgi:large subunit ribosomal protein L21